jgi:hypothetical protein
VRFRHADLVREHVDLQQIEQADAREHLTYDAPG